VRFGMGNNKIRPPATIAEDWGSSGVVSQAMRRTYVIVLDAQISQTRLHTGRELTSMAYPSTSIANYFLERASQEGRAITPMQLLKLVYIAHGWHLGYTGQKLITEEVQAWRHGPVIKALYDRLKHFGSGAVRGLIAESPFGGLPQPVGADVMPMLDGVWRNYARFSGVELSQMTHMPGTPWSVAWHMQGGKNMMFAPISAELIRDHYQGKIREAHQGG
jgi:uncharacterized phage-associated protein